MCAQANLGGTFKNRGVNGRRISLKGMRSRLEAPVPNAAAYRVNFGRLLFANKTWKETKKTHILFLFCPKRMKRNTSGCAGNAASPSPSKEGQALLRSPTPK